MRRVLVMAALSAVALVATAGPAAAHPGIENPYVPAGVATTLALGVPSESAAPMVEVDVAFPPDFELHHVDSVPGWQSETTAGEVRFHGGNVPEGGYAQFTFTGVFAAKRVVELPVTTVAADGTAVVWDQAPGQGRPAAVALPGYPPGAAPVPGLTVAAGRGRGHGAQAAVVGAAAVLAVAVAVGARRRRRATATTVATEAAVAPGVVR